MSPSGLIFYCTWLDDTIGNPGNGDFRLYRDSNNLGFFGFFHGFFLISSFRHVGPFVYCFYYNR